MLLVVPGADPEPWPTIGAEVVDFFEDRAVYGKGSLEGEPYVVDPEFKAFIYRAFEVYPKIVTKSFAGGGPGFAHQGPTPMGGPSTFQACRAVGQEGPGEDGEGSSSRLRPHPPEGPAKCDGFDASGNPVAAPTKRPYVPMLAFSLEQVEELAYGTLAYIVQNGPDADLFDVSLERIIRLDEYGREDGKALPLAQSPDSRDGALTTLNAFDEPHRLYMPRHLKAHETMDANLEKRPSRTRGRCTSAPQASWARSRWPSSCTPRLSRSATARSTSRTCSTFTVPTVAAMT